MLRIGEFAALTGLSVKALRHYDETGVLVASDVDPRSGYRSYAEGQVRAGVSIRALRDAGVPLPAVATAVADGEFAQTLRTHHRQVLEQRDREDRAFRDAETVLSALAVPVAVGERTMPAQPFVGRSITAPVADVESLCDADATAVLEDLFTRLQETGLGPSGPFWTELRAMDRGTIEVRCCWPTVSEVPAGTCGPGSVSAVLPARTELVATWRPTNEDDLPEYALHPAVVALFDAVNERGLHISDAEVRQTARGQGPDDYVVEVSLTVGENSA